MKTTTMEPFKGQLDYLESFLNLITTVNGSSSARVPPMMSPFGVAGWLSFLKHCKSLLNKIKFGDLALYKINSKLC